MRACLHGLVEVENLVFGLGLEEVQAGVEPGAALVDVTDDLPPVLLHPLPDLLQERDTVAGRVSPPGKKYKKVKIRAKMFFVSLIT